MSDSYETELRGGPCDGYRVRVRKQGLPRDLIDMCHPPPLQEVLSNPYGPHPPTMSRYWLDTDFLVRWGIYRYDYVWSG